ncbi:MAG: hypothetical protein K5656_07955 [Lachnospiraceae bacterium]|nr:hypothetical protein [Lachnospiraceae bacterium]
MDKTKLLRVVIIILGIALVVLGIFHNDVRDVLNKAIRICYECIGIGVLL